MSNPTPAENAVTLRNFLNESGTQGFSGKAAPSEPTPPQPASGEPFKSGFAALVGVPNTGKSTFLNALLGQKISIVSPKPQTTRTQIRGILSGEGFQTVLVDTPGIHEEGGALNRRIVRSAYEALKNMDLILFFTDLSAKRNGVPDREKKIMEAFPKAGTPIFLIINKIDLHDKEALLRQIQLYNAETPFERTIPLSALRKTNLDSFLKILPEYLPEGCAYYGADEITDQPVRAMAAEMVREQVFLQTHKEIPYDTHVEIERFKEEAKRVVVFACIHVARESQKGIVLGKNGKVIKAVGIHARKQIEKIVGSKVYLDLHVRVSGKWNRDEKMLTRFGL